MDANLYLANYYFSLLNTLSSKAKLYLATKLMNSVLKEENASDVTAEAEKDAAFHRLAGVWADDPEATTMTSVICNGRISNHTRHLASFDE